MKKRSNGVRKTKVSKKTLKTKKTVRNRIRRQNEEMKDFVDNIDKQLHDAYEHWDLKRGDDLQDLRSRYVNNVIATHRPDWDIVEEQKKRDKIRKGNSNREKEIRKIQKSQKQHADVRALQNKLKIHRADERRKYIADNAQHSIDGDADHISALYLADQEMAKYIGDAHHHIGYSRYKPKKVTYKKVLKFNRKNHIPEYEGTNPSLLVHHKPKRVNKPVSRSVTEPTKKKEIWFGNKGQLIQKTADTPKKPLNITFGKK